MRPPLFCNSGELRASYFFFARFLPFFFVAFFFFFAIANLQMSG
jgi:hypothetical protein